MTAALVDLLARDTDVSGELVVIERGRGVGEQPEDTVVDRSAGLGHGALLWGILRVSCGVNNVRDLAPLATDRRKHLERTPLASPMEGLSAWQPR